MFGRDKGDRGTLVALGMVLLAIVLLAAITQPMQQVGQAKAPQNSPSEQGQDMDKAPQSHINDNKWHVWGDSWAQWVMAFFTAAATLVSLKAVFLVRDTLNENANAVKEAREANKASWAAVGVANRAADDAYRLGKVQMRGYVTCDGGKFWFQDKVIWVEILLTNRGQSPVFEGKMQGSIVLAGEGIDVFSIPVAGGFGALATGESGPCFLVEPLHKIDLQHLEWLRSESGKIFLNVRLFWTDVFGEELWAEYAISQDGGFEWEKANGAVWRGASLRAVCVNVHRE